MFSMMIEFLNLVLAALVVGAMFGVGLILNPAGLNAGSYVELQQQAIRTLDKPMPRLGAATILVTILAAIVASGDKVKLGLLVAAVVCFVASGLITRLVNQPINATVMTWSSDAPPSEWGSLRDEWWRWHSLRLAAGFGGFCLLTVATVIRRG